MYNVSTEFKNKIKQNSRRIAGKLLLGNLELTPEDIINMSMEYSLGNDGIPAIGGAVASKFEVKLFRNKLPPVLTTQELKPYLGIEVSSGEIEYVPMGVFRISPKDTKKADKTILLIGYDILFLLENSPYNSKLKFPNTLNNIKTELENKGLKFAPQTLTNVTIKEKPNTIRELLSDVSELLGMNVVTNKLGEIEFRKLTTVDFNLYANNYYDFKLLADDNVKLTRLTVEKEGEENKDLTYGNDTGYTIKIKNSSINTQSELKTAYNRAFPLNYTAYECNIQGMPHIEIGDIINLTDRHGIKRNIPIVYHRISYSGGLRSEIKASAPSGAISSTGSTGSNSITQSLNDLKVNILEVNTVLADKVSTNELDANVARIEKIINTNLESINAKIKVIETEDLTAINAHITALQSNVAQIDTTLSKEIFTELASIGQIVAGSSIIADGAIGDAQISSLTAGKIRSGTIDTSLVTVAGSDGKLNITGNRLQVIHEGLERVALGDVNRDGSVYGLRVRGIDGETVLFDEKGITKEGITEGSIDDSKVGDDANIQGHKLDINSVIREVNDAGTEIIKGTRVQVGDRSLEVELGTMQSSIGDNTEELSTQRSQIQALDKSIKLKVDNQTFTEYKSINDENITTINTQLSKNTTSIDILQEEIAFKVSQTDVERLINEIDIVGRNLFLDTGQQFDWDVSDPNTRNPKDNNIRLFPDQEMLQGREVTMSMEVKTENLIYIWDAEYSPWLGFEIRLDFEDGTYSYILQMTREIEEGTSNSWVKYSKTVTIPNKKITPNINRKATVLMKGATGKVSIKNIKLEFGTKATDWTPAPEDVESEITKVNTKMAEIDINLEGITNRVSSTESEIVNINDEVSTIESRVSIAEQKITDDAIINTVRISTAYISDLGKKANQNDLNNTNNIVSKLEQKADSFQFSIDDYKNGILKGARYIFDGEKFTIRNAYEDTVFDTDTHGNLSIVGDFKTYQNDKKAMHMAGNRIYLYDWETTEREEHVGILYSSRQSGDPNKPGISLGHGTNARMGFVYKDVDGNYYPYIHFDKFNLSKDDIGYPIRTYTPLKFKDEVYFDHYATMGYGIRFPSSTAFIDTGGNNHLIIQMDTAGLIFNNRLGNNVFEYSRASSRWLFDRNVHINRNLSVTGKKNSLQKTENYGDRLLNSLETPEYYFQDRGSGKTDKNGYCYLYIDDIFDETVNTNMQYHVDIQEYGEGTLRPIERNPRYFIVKGTPNLDFSWTLTAKRKGYEYDRLETLEKTEENEEVNINFLINDEEEKQAKKELKNMIDYELTFNLADYVLVGGE